MIRTLEADGDGDSGDGERGVLHWSFLLTVRRFFRVGGRTSPLAAASAS